MVAMQLVQSTQQACGTSATTPAEITASHPNKQNAFVEIDAAAHPTGHHLINIDGLSTRLVCVSYLCCKGISMQYGRVCPILHGGANEIGCSRRSIHFLYGWVMKVSWLKEHQLDVGLLYQNWGSQYASQQPLKSSHYAMVPLHLTEDTFGIATNLNIMCCCSTYLPKGPEGRKKVPHSTTIFADKATMQSSSSVMQFTLKNRLVMATQMIGCGGLHASILLAFLDLPNTALLEKCSWQWRAQ